MYSRKAVDLWSQIGGGVGSFRVSSPDTKSTVLVQGVTIANDDERVVLEVNGALGKARVDLGPGVGSELTWAPNAKAFFVTTSDQGLNGSYRLIVVEAFNGRLAARDLTKLIYKQFGHPVRCGGTESPNVGGVGWINDGHILVAAEIVNHSNCDSSGTFKTYEVDPIRMRIVRSYSQLEAKQKFRTLLGGELKDAPDECIRNPKICYVSTNHEKSR